MCELCDMLTDMHWLNASNVLTTLCNCYYSDSCDSYTIYSLTELKFAEKKLLLLAFAVI